MGRDGNEFALTHHSGFPKSKRSYFALPRLVQPCRVERRPFQQALFHSFVRDSVLGLVGCCLLPVAVESPLGALERWGTCWSGVWRGGVGDFQEVRLIDHGWKKKDMDVRREEESRMAGFCVLRELFA